MAKDPEQRLAIGDRGDGRAGGGDRRTARSSRRPPPPPTDPPPRQASTGDRARRQRSASTTGFGTPAPATPARRQDDHRPPAVRSSQVGPRPVIKRSTASRCSIALTVILVRSRPSRRRALAARQTTAEARPGGQHAHTAYLDGGRRRASKPARGASRQSGRQTARRGGQRSASRSRRHERPREHVLEATATQLEAIKPPAADAAATSALRRRCLDEGADPVHGDGAGRSRTPTGRGTSTAATAVATTESERSTSDRRAAAERPRSERRAHRPARSARALGAPTARTTSRPRSRPSVTVGAFADAVAHRLGARRPQPGRHARAHRRRRCAATSRCSPRASATATRSRSAPPRVQATPTASARFDLVVVGGPVAGKMVSLARGHVHDRPRRELRRHARRPVDVAPAPAREGRRPDAVTVVDPGSNNGTFVRDAPLRHHEPYTLSNGERAAARAQPDLDPAEPPAPRRARRRRRRATSPSTARRASRAAGSRRSSSSPPRPARPTKARLPLAASLAPLLMGAVMYFVTKSPLMLLFMALTPVLAVWTWVEDRRGGKKASAEQLARWEAELDQARRATLRRAAVEEEHERNAAAPDAGELIHRAVSHTADLWERRPTDPDFLHLRVGTADQPAQYEVARRVRRRGGPAQARERASRASTGRSPPRPCWSRSPRPARSASAARRRASPP